MSRGGDIAEKRKSFAENLNSFLGYLPFEKIMFGFSLPSLLLFTNEILHRDMLVKNTNIGETHL